MVAARTPTVFASVASKGLRVPVNPLDATLMSILVSVASKELECGGLRPKTGKTRCLSVSADCKRLTGKSLPQKKKRQQDAGASDL
jgi:hypothetical protein